MSIQKICLPTHNFLNKTVFPISKTLFRSQELIHAAHVGDHLI